MEVVLLFGPICLLRQACNGPCLRKTDRDIPEERRKDCCSPATLYRTQVRDDHGAYATQPSGSRIHEEQAYKSCMGVINFSRTYGNARLEKACHKAFSLNSVTYSTLKNILKNGQESVPASDSSDADTPTPYHENLRIGEWK